jgi:spore coat protein A
MLTRRQLLERGAAGTAGLMLGGALLERSAVAVPPVASTLTPYLDPMPTLLDNLIDATNGGTFDLRTALISRQLPPTTLFGYLRSGGPGPMDTAASYLGPVIVAKSRITSGSKPEPVVVNYTNNLASDAYKSVFTNNGSSYAQFNPFNPVETRILTHLHGAIDSGDSDGNPFATPGAYASGAIQTATYPNEQAATLSWYHDHLLGDTRMNVVAGLAGGYLLRDDFDNGSNPVLPSGGFELPMVVQDRQFNADGSLLYPVAPASTNGPWIGEYFGDVMMVNGKIWPNLTVQPAVYRFRMLNGCNARVLNLTTSPNVPMFIIGTEGGLLPLNPVATNSLLMAPAERLDVICDFRRFAGRTLLLQNIGPPASVVSTPAPPSLTKVMQITVNNGTPSGSPPLPGSLKDPLVNDQVTALTGLGTPLLSGGTVKGRMITLNEIGARTPAWRLNLNAGPYGGPDAVTETVKWNSVEDWYFVNFTADTHPMHTHLFSFRVMGRYNFDAKRYAAAFPAKNNNGVSQQDVATLTPYLTSNLIAPDPTETGLKETVRANPGQVTVVRAMFIPPSTAFDALGNLTTQKYVHHCHIVEHEDNDMMERVLVQP